MAHDGLGHFLAYCLPLAPTQYGECDFHFDDRYGNYCGFYNIHYLLVAYSMNSYFSLSCLAMVPGYSDAEERHGS